MCQRIISMAITANQYQKAAMYNYVPIIYLLLISKRNDILFIKRSPRSFETTFVQFHCETKMCVQFLYFSSLSEFQVS